MITDKQLLWMEVYYSREANGKNYVRRINGMDMLKKIRAVKAMREESE